MRRSLGDWEDFWALQDVTFDVAKGQTLGVIGSNGSGKSTLLKVLTGILPADAGRATVNGRVSSLLELGAGFQIEYTGRENIFLYGALLGLRRREIEDHFDQIVEFSELGSRIEQPVKNYSSGMYMRLGFSVAVHLDPEILLIDEVLAVGDEGFQQKCFEHLNALRGRGVTILLVSHDLDAVSRFCERAVWLDKGRLAADGPAQNTIDQYLEAASARPVEGRPDLQPTGDIEVTAVRYLNGQQQPSRTIRSGDHVTLELTCRVSRDIANAEMQVTIFRNDGIRALDAPAAGGGRVRFAAGDAILRLDFPSLSLHAGRYDITFAIYDSDLHRMHVFDQRRHPFLVADERKTGAIVWLPFQWDLGAGVSPVESDPPSLRRSIR